MKKRTYITIDLKSFYASVECLKRGLDPMNTRERLSCEMAAKFLSMIFIW